MNHLGIFGLGTMGANLARNAARNGATVSLFNRTTKKTDEFMKEYTDEGNFVATHTPEEFVKSLPEPRAILIMVKAGDPVDEVIDELVPLLSKGDILIDGGNSLYLDTDRREHYLMHKGIHFVGMGVSGGEEGALNGPSLMPGGSEESYTLLEPLLKKMAADDGDGGKCVAHIGTGGTGHFVKMVHNGIEYGIMQLIAEAYDLLKREGEMTNDQIADVFEEWNQTDMLQSFLTEITVKVLRKKDPKTNESMVDQIEDVAEQKGTGKWTISAALDYGVAVPTMTAAVEARIISSGKDFRVMLSKQNQLATESKKKIPDLVSNVKAALELSIANVYAQGFQLLFVSSDTEKWNLNISEIARIWRGGCIIRSVLLEHYQKMFAGDKKASKFLSGKFTEEAQKAWRSIVALGAERGIPLPATSASLSYYDAYRTEHLPQNLIQGLRDFFGAHGVLRVDGKEKEHINWE